MNKFRSLIVLFLLIGFVGINAQEATINTAVNKYPTIEKKITKSEKDLVNPKKNISAKYWLSRAEMMMDAYYVNYEHLIKGTQELLIDLQFGTPTEKKTEEKEGITYITNIYERVNVVFVNGVVDSYEETKAIHPNPLPIAKEALEKAEELDVDKKLNKKILPAYIKLSDLFERQAIEAFVKNDFKNAFVNFEVSVIIGQKPIMDGNVDTITIYNAGMVAAKANLPKESIKYYELAIDYNFDDPAIYTLLQKKYFEVGDTAKGVELLSDGFKRYPNNLDIVFELINYYLLNNMAEQALEYLVLAQEKDPTNGSLIFAEAYLYDKNGDIDKAIVAYKRCIEAAPNYYNGYYNLGVLYFNYAQKFYTESMDASDSEYKSIEAKGDEQLKLAIPLMKKCYELNSDELGPLETLKSIYYKLKMMADYEEIKALLE